MATVHTERIIVAQVELDLRRQISDSSRHNYKQQLSAIPCTRRRRITTNPAITPEQKLKALHLHSSLKPQSIQVNPSTFAVKFVTMHACAVRKFALRAEPLLTTSQ